MRVDDLAFRPVLPVNAADGVRAWLASDPVNPFTLRAFFTGGLHARRVPAGPFSR